MEQLNQISLVALEAFWVRLSLFDRVLPLILLVDFGPLLHHQNLKDLQLSAMAILLLILHRYCRLVQITQYHYSLGSMVAVSLHRCFHQVSSSLLVLQLVLGSISLLILLIYVLSFIAYVKSLIILFLLTQDIYLCSFVSIYQWCPSFQDK